MAETTDDVRRDIELTRERMSETIAQLEQKLDVAQMVRDHPWPAIGMAAAAGFLLGSGSGGGARTTHAVGAGAAAPRGPGSRLAPLLDDLLGRVVLGVQDVLEQKAEALVSDLRRAVGAPPRDVDDGRRHPAERGTGAGW